MHSTLLYLAIKKEAFVVILNRMYIPFLELAFHSSWFVWFNQFLRANDKKIEYSVET